jgi:hypothetical protein
MSGKKTDKFRITIAFMTNATGTEKLKPLFIEKYSSIRSLGASRTHLQAL